MIVPEGRRGKKDRHVGIVNKDGARDVSAESALRRLPLERLHESTDVRLHLNLIELQGVEFLWHRRQIVSFHGCMTQITVLPGTI